MSRPNNPGAPTGGQQPPRQHGQEQQAQPPAWPPPAQAAPGWQSPQQGGYAPAGYPSQSPTADPYGAAAYHHPQPPQSEPYFAQQQQPPQQQPVAPGRQNYAPQFERFAPPPQTHGQTHTQGHPQVAHQAPGQQHLAARAPAAPQQEYQAGYHADDGAYAALAAAPPPQPRMAQPPRQPTPGARQPSPPPPRPPAPDLRGTLADQWPASAPPHGSGHGAPRQQDPRGYNLGAYDAPGQAREQSQRDHGQGGRPQAGYAQDLQAAPQHLSGGHPVGQRAEWQPVRTDRGQPAGYPEPQMDLGGYPSPDAGHQGRAVVAEQDYAHDDTEYEDEPPRRSRGLLIVGALIGAIGLGGGLAYAYKTFLGPSQAGKPPVIKADKSPAKTQPADAGGKLFANQGIKVMGGRLTEGGPSGDGTSVAQTASSAVGEDGIRKVATVPIGRDGSMTAPMPHAPSAAPPGVFVVDPLRRAPPAIQPQMAPPQVVAPPQASANSQQKVISLPPPKAEVQPPARAVAPPPAARAPVAPRVAAATTSPFDAQDVTAPVKKPVARPAAPPASGVGAAGGGGFVVVLSSQRSQMDALKMFADLQQKYGVLQGRTPTVQEANLGEKGIYHRLLVGPAGPRDQASALCTELKASGHKDCWVMAQ